MGQDKALLSYHGMPQYQFLSEVCDAHCTKVFISVRLKQKATWAQTMKYQLLLDNPYDDIKGPLAAILSYTRNSQSPVLVIACDYPNIKNEAIAEILNKRNSDKDATCYQLHDQIEPLFCILEASILRNIDHYLQHGVFSLKGLLKKADTHWLNTKDDQLFFNANTKEDYDQYMSSQHDKKSRNNAL